MEGGKFNWQIFITNEFTKAPCSMQFGACLVLYYLIAECTISINGFRKVDPDRWEFANEGFLRGQKHLLKNISRRKPVHGHNQQQHQHGQNSSVGACVEVGKFGLEEEVERLKRDKNVLMQELVRLRQQQQATDGQLQATVQRLQGMEQRQQQMMSFLAKAVNSPGFLAQFMQQQNDSSLRITEGNKKRRFKQDGISDEDSVGSSDGQIIKYEPLMNEAAKSMLRQIIKLDSSPRLGDGSLPSNALDGGSSSNRVSGVTLQEVPPTSGHSFIPMESEVTGHSPSAAISEIQPSSLGATSETVTDQFLDVSQLVGAPEVPPVTLPPTDAIMPELSQIVRESDVDVMTSETESGAFMDPSSLALDAKILLEIGVFSPDSQMAWDNAMLDDEQDLPGVSDSFWEKFLQSPPPVGTEEMDSTLTNELPEAKDTKPLENGWDKSQHVAQLTEQMGLLSSDIKKE
ncbi:Heat stress transcription factor A-1d [Abeliophyllum distichum]|uniref:Heat stress transcription factor A-1d n=1 Tax=Abeliophyllum distichum TaxID=126358 RepID=A0ABD1TZY9_9LAMI